MPINFEAVPNQAKLNSVKQLKSKRNKDDESRRMSTTPGLDHDQDKVLSANQTNLKGPKVGETRCMPIYLNLDSDQDKPDQTSIWILHIPRRMPL